MTKKAGENTLRDPESNKTPVGLGKRNPAKK